MEGFTPFETNTANITKIDGTELTTNLFKDASLKAPPSDEKLATYLRIRPEESQESGSKPDWFIVDNDELITTNIEKNRKYMFSKIYNRDTSNQDFYNLCTRPILTKFISGNSALLFAYGTTNSGKSYTMRGTNQDPGVIPRSLRTIFNTLKKSNISERPLLKRLGFSDFYTLSEKEVEIELDKTKFITSGDGVKNLKSSTNSIMNSTENIDIFLEESLSDSTLLSSEICTDVWVSCVEFHNEKPIDLLPVVEIKQKKNLSLEVLSNGSIKRLQHVYVSSAEEAIKVFLFAQENLKKHISSTNLNEKSSRSHSIFNITLISYINGQSANAFVRTLSLADLAGTERSNRTQNTGDRQKETGQINKSLMQLRHVIAKIKLDQKNGIKDSSVNFRNSKLTKAFKPYLQGSNIAAMIVNINPAREYSEESVFTLDFSETAADIIVTTEESRLNFQTTFKRLTQMWMESTQRWSTFAQSAGLDKHKHSSIAIPESIVEEEEEEEEDQLALNETFAEEISVIDSNLSMLSDIDFDNIDPKILEKLRKAQEILLKRFEDEKFDLEVNVRGQLVSEMGQMMEEIRRNHEKDMKDTRDRLDELMDTRLNILRRQKERESEKYERKIEKLENDNYELRETIAEHESTISELRESSKSVPELSNQEKIVESSAETDEKLAKLANDNQELRKNLTDYEATIKELREQISKSVPAEDEEKMDTSVVSSSVFTSTEDLSWRHYKSTLLESVNIFSTETPSRGFGTNTELTILDAQTSSQDLIFLKNQQIMAKPQNVNQSIQTEAVEDLKTKFKELEKELQENKGYIESLCLLNQTADEDIKGYQATIQELEDQKRKYIMDIESLEQDKKTAQMEIQKYKINIKELEEEKDEYMIKNEELNQTTEEEQEKHKTSVQQFENDLKENDVKIERLKSKIKQLEEAEGAYKKDVQELEEKLKDCSRKHREKETELNQRTKEEQEKYKTSVQQFENDLKENDAKIESLNSKIKLLEEAEGVHKKDVQELEEKLKDVSKKHREKDAQLESKELYIQNQNECTQKLNAELQKLKEQKIPKIPIAIDLTDSPNLTLSSTRNLTSTSVTASSALSTSKITDMYMKNIRVTETEKKKKEVKREKEQKETKREKEHKEVVIEDDIGAAAFASTSKHEGRRTRRGKRAVEKDAQGASCSKRTKIPHRESRCESVSPIPEKEEEKKPGPGMRLRARKKLNM